MATARPTWSRRPPSCAPWSRARTDYRPNFADGLAVIGVAEAVVLAAQQGHAVELTTVDG